ncbi:MAG: ABC transporter ATP-binding protein [Dehalococcoidia bacterium]
MDTSLRRSAATLATYLAGLRVRVAVLGTLLIGGTLLQLTGPQLLRLFIDDAVGGAPAQRLYVFAGLFIAATVVTQIALVGAAYLSEQVGWTATNRLRADLLAHCLRLDLPFHNAHSPGGMIERVDGDVTALSDFFSQFVLRILGGLLLLTGVLALLMYEEWRVGLALTAFVVFAMVVISRARAYAVPAVNAERDASAELYGFIEERLGAVDDIRANGAGAYVMQRSFGVAGHLIRTARRAQILSGGLWSLATGLFTFSYVLVLALGALLYQRGEVTIGAVYLFFQYTQILRRPLEQIADQLKEFQRAAAAVGRVNELLALEPILHEGTRDGAVDGAAAVEFDHVSFAYDAREPVLRDIDFTLAPGSVVGVLGRTGGGKTTLTRLLLRLYDPTEGVVRLDGVDLRALRAAELRRRIGVVTQDVQLVAGSVRDNLTLFDPAITDARIGDAIDGLGLGDWVRSLPDGLDTMLAAGGAGLSAGEGQLLAFARIFLRDPGLVILDEASSRLDPATEHLIERAVDRLLTGRTGIVIAHRLHTVERADVVMVIEHGRIAECGERTALAGDASSRYAGLLRAGAGAVAV